MNTIIAFVHDMTTAKIWCAARRGIVILNILIKFLNKPKKIAKYLKDPNLPCIYFKKIYQEFILRKSTKKFI